MSSKQKGKKEVAAGKPRVYAPQYTLHCSEWLGRPRPRRSASVGKKGEVDYEKKRLPPG